MKMLFFTRGSQLVKSLLCLGIAMTLVGAAHAQNLKVEAKLVWGTDDAQSPNPHHHLLEPGLTRRLKGSPYRWKNYFEENHQVVEIPVGQTKAKIIMSDRCTLDIKNLGDERVEVRLHGNGKPVSVHKESLKGNGLLVLGGDAANETAWLVTIRKAAPPTSPPPLAK
jgi:hypothetical protein